MTNRRPQHHAPSTASSLRRILCALLFAFAAFPAPAQEVYYDQFDWGADGGDINEDFWNRFGSFSGYFPNEPQPPNEGILQLRRLDNGISRRGTQPLTPLLPSLDYTVHARVEMAEFTDTAGERNAELALRSNGSEGYLLTIDGGNDVIRLRRQGGDFTDFLDPVPHPIVPGDEFFLRATVEGTSPTMLRAVVSRQRDFSDPVAEFTHNETEWQPLGDRIELIGFTQTDGHTFDWDYFAIGSPDYPHSVDDWNRTLYTNAPEEPISGDIGDLDAYEVYTTGVLLMSGESKIRLLPRLDKTIRVDLAPRGEFPPEHSYAVTRTDWPAPDFRTIEDPDLVLEGPGWRVRVSTSPLRLTYEKPDGAVLLRDNPSEWILFGPDYRRVAFELAPDDNIYGLGEHSTNGAGGINRRGRTYYLDNRHEAPSFLMWAFWVSNKNYGVFIDNPAEATISFGGEVQEAITYETEFGELSYYVFFGDSMGDVVDQYTQVTGRPALAPRWTFGNVQSKYGYTSFAEIQGIVDGFRDRQIPLDAIVIDLFWFGQPYMGNLEFQDTPEWANPTQNLAGLREQGIKTVPITEPQMTTFSFNIQEAYEMELFTRDSENLMQIPGQDLGWIAPGPIFILDFTNPDTREWWIGKHEKLIREYQFDGFWQDLNEPEGLVNEMMFHDGPARAVHNVLALEMNRSLNEAMDRYAPNKRPFIMSRSGYAGMQKYGASVWSGDVQARWDHLEEQVAIAASMGLAGVPYWNSDIGGFNGKPTPELYLRWCQFGFFNPLYRPHGAFSDREPWRFGEEVEAAVRDLLRLRYRLIPHHYTIARQSYETGAPIMRPLVMDWPQDERTWNLNSQFMYGESLMAAPITAPEVPGRSVYLPEGTWFDWFTGEALVGGGDVDFLGGAADFPFYVRAPAIIPLGPEMMTSDEAPLDAITLRVYAPYPMNAEGRLYEDDGLTKDYQRGIYADTLFRALWRGTSHLSLDIAAPAQTVAGMPAIRAYDLEVHGLNRVEGVSADGLELAQDAVPGAPGPGWTFDADARILRVRLAGRSVTQSREVLIQTDRLPWSGWILK
ncbi:MAG: glycoside hydrolase family 31 protein [Sumerlaeia bacterium]